MGYTDLRAMGGATSDALVRNIRVPKRRQLRRRVSIDDGIAAAYDASHGPRDVACVDSHARVAMDGGWPADELTVGISLVTSG